MSGGKGGSQTTQVEIPSWIQQPSIRNMARAEALQKVGYQPYMGPDVAGFTQPQQQAMQSNLNAAAAFGLVDPGLDAMAGMPQATPLTYDADGLPSRTGLQGYSSYPMYQKAVDDYEAANPGQARQYNNLFVNPQSGLGGTIGTGMMGGGINSGGQNNSGAGSQTGDPGDVGQFSVFDPTNYSISDANPYGVNFTAQAPDMTGYITADQLDQRLSAMQPTAPQDMSGFATTEQLNDALANLPTYQPQDLSGYARTTDLYDDSQLRQDINSRFNNINTFDPSGLQAQITANQQGLANLPTVSAPDLSGYATTNDLQQAIQGLPTPQMPDLSGYATTNDLTSAISGLDIPAYTAPDLSGYATTNDLTQAIAGLPPAQMPDLSGYATTNDLTSAISGIPQFDPTNLQNQITANQTAIGNVPQYNDQGLLAAIQANQNAISGINTYDDTQLRQDINNRFNNFTPNVDLSNYVTNSQLQQGLSSFTPYNDEALRADINARFGNIATFDPSGLQAQITALQNANNAVAPITPQVAPLTPQTISTQQVPLMGPAAQTTSLATMPAVQGLSFTPKGF